MQRYALGGTKEDLTACARLLQLAPDARLTERLLAGLEASLSGGSAEQLPAELKSAIARNWQGGAGGARLALGVRAGIDDAVRQALGIVRDEKAEAKKRLEFVRLFGEVEERRSVPVLLETVAASRNLELRQAALASLRRYDDPAVPARALEWAAAKDTHADLYASLLSLLASRPGWSLDLLRAVDAGKLNPKSIPLDAVRTMKLHKDKSVGELIGKHWGAVREATPAEKGREIDRVAALLKAGTGEPKAGHAVFANTCGKCHKLFKEGGEVGPDLTGYERDNLGFWLENIVDPSAAIRDEFTNFSVVTTDGRSLTGIIVEQNKQSISLRGHDGQTVRLARDRIEDLNASPVSLMPDDQLRALTDQQVRDLFAYLRAKTAPR
jgi:putative heme-binding domain-containing protein